jgi:flagellar hook-associated protein 1 FlgK
MLHDPGNWKGKRAMSDIKNIFNIGQSALQAAKTGIEVTAQNIANVNTPGYNKKELILATKQIPRGSPHPFHGVDVIGLKRAYQEELSNQIINQQEESAYWQTKQEYLSTLEEVFNESDELGLNSDLNQFWNAWQRLSTDPNSHEERQEVISSANRLAETFHSRAQNTQNILKNIKDEIYSVLDEIRGGR